VKTFIAIFAGLAIAIAGFAMAGNPDALIQIRTWLFASAVPASLIEMPPDELLGHGFLSEHKSSAPDADSTYSPERPESAMALSIQLIREFSVGGGIGCGTFTGSLASEREWVRSGHGCCSDHVDVFLYEAAKRGLFVREVFNSLHSFVEVYDQRRRAWEFVDPTGALYAVDTTGVPLSAQKLRARLLTQGPVRWMMFGVARTQPADTASRWFRETYGEGAVRERAWESMMYTWGNNIEYQRSLPSLPGILGKSLSQLLWRSVNQMPRYKYVIDSSASFTARALRSKGAD
jgi:hypothetical protein